MKSVDIGWCTNSKHGRRNTGEGYLVTVSTLGKEHPRVNVYDSMHVLHCKYSYTEQVASILSMHFMDALQSSLTSSMYHFSQDHSIVSSIIMQLQMLSLLLWD